MTQYFKLGDKIIVTNHAKKMQIHNWEWNTINPLSRPMLTYYDINSGQIQHTTHYIHCKLHLHN